MEDAHTHILGLANEEDSAFFAVYDGHGGKVLSICLQYMLSHSFTYMLLHDFCTLASIMSASKYNLLSADLAKLTEKIINFGLKVDFNISSVTFHFDSIRSFGHCLCCAYNVTFITSSNVQFAIRRKIYTILLELNFALLLFSLFCYFKN